MKSFFAFVIGFAATYIAYRFLKIPVLPSLSVYIVANLFSESRIFSRARMIFIWITALFGAFIWGMDASISIALYPEYLNVLGIVFAVLNVIAYLGTIGFFASVQLSAITDITQEEKLSSSYDQGFDAGYKEGSNAGKDMHFETGFYMGYKKGHDDGTSEGYEKGHKDTVNGNYKPCLPDSDN